MGLVSCVSATIFEQMCTEVYAGGFNDGGRSTAFYCMMLESWFVPGTIEMSLITCDVPECTSCDARQNDSFCGELAPLGLWLAGYCLEEKGLCLFWSFGQGSGVTGFWCCNRLCSMIGCMNV